jgi:micrococcal nuclease
MGLAVAPACGWGRSLPQSGEVAFVCDGDTIILESGERVRYLGVDAPEIEHDKAKADCFGEDARRVNSELVLHKRVFLHYDREKTDQHGRLLAYVMLPNGKCANAEMLRAGYACVFRPAQDFRRLDEFLLLQKEAIHQHKGMWGACSVKPEKNYTGHRASFVFHRPECFLGRKIAVGQRIRFPDRWTGLDQGYRPCRYCKP